MRNHILSFFVHCAIHFFFKFCYFFWRFYVTSVTIKNCHLNVANNGQCVFVFLFSSGDDKIRRPFASGAQFFSPALRRSFFPFFSSPPPSFLGFFNRDEAARLAGRQPSVRYLGCSLLQRGSRNPRGDIQRLAHLLLLSLSLSKEWACYSSLACANVIFSRRERFVSRYKEGTRNFWFLFSVRDWLITFGAFEEDEKNTNNAKIQGYIKDIDLMYKVSLREFVHFSFIRGYFYRNSRKYNSIQQSNIYIDFLFIPLHGPMFPSSTRKKKYTGDIYICDQWKLICVVSHPVTRSSSPSRVINPFPRVARYKRNSCVTRARENQSLTNDVRREWGRKKSESI